MIILAAAVSPAFAYQTDAAIKIGQGNVSVSLLSTVPVGQVQTYNDGQWYRINTSLITILFPANGQKPMFLWYYTNDSSRVFAVKYVGLVEYMALNQSYYMPSTEANPQTMQSLMMTQYGVGVGMGNQRMESMRARIATAYLSWITNFHPSFLPFESCRWTLTGPVIAVGQDGASYVSFNFTLQNAPPRFSFANDNIVIRCRFYVNQTTQQPFGLYNYTVLPGQMKMDLVIRDWNWNLDQMNSFLSAMQNQYNIAIPLHKGGLALWTDMATINIQNLSAAQADANEPETGVPDSSGLAQVDPLEANSTMTDMMANGQRIHVQNEEQTQTVPLNTDNRLNGSFRLQFATGDKTLAGFFDFVNTAAIINQTTGAVSTVNVAAAYRTSGNYMQVFIGYPYFGANTLEHDPTIGLDTSAAVVPENLPLILVATAIFTMAAAIALKLRKKTLS